MPFAHHRAVRIHYETEGAGSPLVLLHGFSARLESWRVLGWTRPLAARHQLVLIDARGHGRSDKPHEPAAYTLPERVGDVLAVLDALRVPAAHFLGYSAGGLIGFALARQAPERLRSLAVGGAHPYPSRAPALGAVDGRDPNAFVAAMEAVMGERLPAETRRLVLANDLLALAAIARSRSEPAAPLAPLEAPTFLFVGEADRCRPEVARYAAEAPRATLLDVPGCNHVETMGRSDLVVPSLLEFLRALDA